VNDLHNIVNHKDTELILSRMEDTVSMSVFNTYLFGYLKAGHACHKITFVDTNLRVLTYQLGENGVFPDFSCYDSLDCSVVFDDKLDNAATVWESNLNKNKPVINVGDKVYNNNGEVIGGIIMEIAYERIDEIMFEDNEYNGLGHTGEVYLVGDDFLMRSSSRFQNNSILETVVKTKGVKLALDGVVGLQKIKDYRNIDVFSSYSPLSLAELNWVVLSEIDCDEAMTSIYQVENHIFYLSIIISLFLLGVIAAVSANITSPIRKLQLATEDILKGNYGKTIPQTNKDEIGDLIHAFNNMTMMLKEQAERLAYEQVIRSTAVLNGQESEKQRLSRELHDGLAQYILAIKMKLEQALVVEAPQKTQLIKDAIQLFSETIKEIKNISNNLMPAVLKEYGLIKAIENLAQNINAESKLNFVFDYAIESNSFGEKTDVYLYRIIQESLNNTLKYADANSFKVRIVEKEDELQMVIEDDGKGFDLNDTSTVVKGNGLVNIKERVSLLSGNITIDSKKEKGVKIKIGIPL